MGFGQRRVGRVFACTTNGGDEAAKQRQCLLPKLLCMLIQALFGV